jgi:hypothetical protein
MKYFLFLLAILTVGSTQADEAKYGSQIVMDVDRTEDGNKIVVPTAKVVMVFKPISGDTARAPLGSHDKMICRVIHQFHDEDGQSRLAFSCGTDVYVVTTIDFQPEKGK